MTIQAPDFSQLQRVAMTKSWYREVDRAHNAFNRSLNSIRDQSLQGANTKDTVRKFLRSPEVKLSALLRHIDTPVTDQAARNSLRRAARKLNPWQPPRDAVIWHLKRKARGGSRPVSRLPVELKAIHFMIGKLIAAQTVPVPGLYCVPYTMSSTDDELSNPVNNGCRDDAVRHVQRLIQDGYTHIAEVDIVDCFQSFNPDGLADLRTLKLPKEVITQTLDYRNLSFVKGPYHEPTIHLVQHADMSGPRGLLQGSPASSAILAWNLNRVLSDLPKSDDAVVICAFDNFIVAARDEAGFWATHENLVARLRIASFGPLTLSAPKFFGPDGIDFLGYNIAQNGRISIGERSIEKLTERLRSLELIGHSEREVIQSVLALQEFVGGFTAAKNAMFDLSVFVDTLSFYAEPILSPIFGSVADFLYSEKSLQKFHPLQMLIKNEIRQRNAGRSCQTRNY